MPRRVLTSVNVDWMRTLVIITQVYVPDPAAVGQQIADVAAEMIRRDWRVVVFAAARGYENPKLRYPWHETRGGVEICRLPFSSFGKGSMLKRLLGQLLFVTRRAEQAANPVLLSRRAHHGPPDEACGTSDEYHAPPLCEEDYTTVDDAGKDGGKDAGKDGGKDAGKDAGKRVHLLLGAAARLVLGEGL